MKFSLRGWVALIFPVATFFLPVALPAQEGLSDRDEVVHVLNRITFGPKPGDVEAVQKMGLQNYIQQQLHPETLDDSAVEKEIAASFDMLQMSATELETLFIDEQKKQLKKAKEAGLLGTNGAPNPAAPAAAVPVEKKPADGETMMEKLQAHRGVAGISQMEDAKLLREIESPRQLQEVLVDFWGNHFNIDMKKGPCRVLKIVDDRDVIRPHIWGSFRDLLGASAKSPAMLFYLDNASNTVARDTTPKEEQMRVAVLEKMGLPVDDPAATPKKRGGINENYGREIMELHTLGVDGGYTQKDVQEVARCFTGWGIDRQTGEFAFHPRQHDQGEKTVLGHVIPANGGQKDGEMVLDILATQPACAHFIAKELCQRFVSDDPPAGLVNRTAEVFTHTNGDLRQVTESILTSPEFLSPTTFGNKIKSPLEFAVSAVRASQSTMDLSSGPVMFHQLRATMEGAAILGRGQAADRISAQKQQSINWHIYDLGEPLFACTPPTGYKEVSSSWVSPGALIERLNFAMALTEQKISDIHFDAQKILAGTDLDKPQMVLDRCFALLLQNNVSDGTRKVLVQNALPTGESQTVHPDRLIALILGSPEFQRK